MSEQRTVGFVGVGRMGANMARRLRDVGYRVTAVYDARPESARELAAELGSEAATTLARVTELSDVIVTVVTDDAAMRTIYAASGDSLLVNAAGKIFVNSATSRPACTSRSSGSPKRAARRASRRVWRARSRRRARARCT